MDLNYNALTESQLSIWTGQQMNADAPLYNMAHAFHIDGTLNTDVFSQAFALLIEKVEVLRTVIIQVEGIPKQRILRKENHLLQVLDFSRKTTYEIDDWLQERSQVNFDLATQLFDSVLLRVGENEYVWFLNVHHIITDATASTILFNIQAELYQRILENNLDDMIEVPNFQEFSSFQKFHKNNDHNQIIKNHWNEKVQSLATPLQLYGRSPKTNNSSAKRISTNLGIERSNRIRTLATVPSIRCWTKDLTLFNLFTTALFCYLHRVSGQEQFAIGAPSHNRTTKKFKRTPGLFIEFFPLLANISPDDTFLSVFEKVKIETNDYLKNAQAGMSTPETSRSFNIVLNYINATFSDFNDMPIKSKWIHPQHCDPGHQLRCHVYDMDDSGQIEVHFDLNNSVFDKKLQQDLPLHFLKILDGMLDTMEQSIYHPSMVAPPVIEVTNQPSHFISLIEQFEKQVSNTPNSIALREEDITFTYLELQQKVNQLANLLSKNGLATQHRVIVHLHRSTDYILSVLAILKTGATFIPISADQPPKRLSYITKDANCQLLITNTNLANNITSDSVSIFIIDQEEEKIANESSVFEKIAVHEKDIAYLIYTSGSTGNPKGVLISHNAVGNYFNWASSFYANEEQFIFPLCTSIGFDLTITSTFLPLITGGELIIYQEAANGPDISLIEVVTQNKVNAIKLTPSHLALIKDHNMANSKIKTMIVGGEDFKSSLAETIQTSFGKNLRIYNEYGPTEATIGCIVLAYQSDLHRNISVPIGEAILGMSALILDKAYNNVPDGVTGELFLSGLGLAEGYVGLPELTSEKFIENPFNPKQRIYKTGDLVRKNKNGNIVFLGRIDEQVKLRGYRLELSEIEVMLQQHDNITNAAVVVVENEQVVPPDKVTNCSECGLPSNYPKIDFDDNQVCQICVAFKGYKEEAQKYFKTEGELKKILSSKRGESPNYDCISLLSGGKDSTYILAQLVNMGLRVLAFTLDNGYISKQAKDNINRIVTKLNVDHIYGTTEHMNAIFVDSLHRHQNVCNGCFKTIYTLSTQIALAKQIPFVVTGLSRGQFFETRLTEELFWDTDIDTNSIDATILEARKLYHQENDAVKQLLDVSIFDYEDTFNKVEFIDFYRYSDVRLEDMLTFLKEKVDWVRPTDTGRSTNCLINQLGIHVHKKEKGYSNYSFPYSWDVRMGHKTRTETLEEINEVINEDEVTRIAKEIGFIIPEETALTQKKLVAYYTGKKTLSIDLSNYLKQSLPAYMLPSFYKYMTELPLTKNGKADKKTLKQLNTNQLETDTPFVEPNGGIEILLANIWQEVLRINRVSVYDNFIALGGHSLAAIRITARVNDELEVKFPLNKIFEFPTIAKYAEYIEQTLTELLNEQN